ncbi:MAG: hypothetical protein JWP57_4310 [Spirosoma sp.]|nr:hypothetical protein [Spirosoma sp.]
MKNAKSSILVFFRPNSPIWAVWDRFREFVTAFCNRLNKLCYKFWWIKRGIWGKREHYLRFLRIAVTSVTFVTNLKTIVYQLVISIDYVTLICIYVTAVTNPAVVTDVTTVTVFSKVAPNRAFLRTSLYRFSWRSAIPPPVFLGST